MALKRLVCRPHRYFLWLRFGVTLTAFISRTVSSMIRRLCHTSLLTSICNMCQRSQNDFYSDVKKGHMCSLEMNNHLRHWGVLIHADTDQWGRGEGLSNFHIWPSSLVIRHRGETSHLFFFHQQHTECSSLLFKPDLVSSQQSNHTSGIILWRQVSELPDYSRSEPPPPHTLSCSSQSQTLSGLKTFRSIFVEHI